MYVVHVYYVRDSYNIVCAVSARDNVGINKYHSNNNSKIAITQSFQSDKIVPDTYKSFNFAIFVDAAWDGIPIFVADPPRDFITPNY